MSSMQVQGPVELVIVAPSVMELKAATHLKVQAELSHLEVPPEPTHQSTGYQNVHEEGILMVFDSTIRKDSRTHEIDLHFNEEEIVNVSELINQFHTLAFLLKPNTKKSIKYQNQFVLTVRAKKNFTPEAFLSEHKSFLDELAALNHIKEN